MNLSPHKLADKLAPNPEKQMFLINLQVFISYVFDDLKPNEKFDKRIENDVAIGHLITQLNTIHALL